MSKEAMKLALEALKQIDEAMPFPVAKLAQAALREALAEQPAQRKPLNREQEIALREGYFADAEKAYFESRAYFINTAQNRKGFEAGFNRGYEAAHGIKENT